MLEDEKDGSTLIHRQQYSYPTHNCNNVSIYAIQKDSFKENVAYYVPIPSFEGRSCDPQ